MEAFEVGFLDNARKVRCWPFGVAQGVLLQRHPKADRSAIWTEDGLSLRAARGRWAHGSQPLLVIWRTPRCSAMRCAPTLLFPSFGAARSCGGRTSGRVAHGGGSE